MPAGVVAGGPVLRAETAGDLHTKRRTEAVGAGPAKNVAADCPEAERR